MSTVAGRGAGALALLLVLGLAVGFGASWAIGENPAGDGPASPVAAASPSLPVDPAPDLLDDPDLAPLDADLPLVRREVGTGGFRLSLLVPRGWTFSENALNEWQWRPPDHESFGYHLRVEQVESQRQPIDQLIESRIADLDEDELALQVLDQTADSLHYSYVSSNHLRHGYLVWRDLSGSGNAQVEIAVNGREEDQTAMAVLARRIADGAAFG